jgi:hypothetical protein
MVVVITVRMKVLQMFLAFKKCVGEKNERGATKWKKK